MHINTLLRILHDQRVKLTQAQQQLHYRALSGGLDAAALAGLQQHKTSLLAWLAQRNHHDTRVFSLNAELLSRLNGVALSHQCQLDTLLLAAFAILLARYKQTTSVSIASNIGTAKCLTLSWDNAASFIEVLKQVQHCCHNPEPEDTATCRDNLPEARSLREVWLSGLKWAAEDTNIRHADAVFSVTELSVTEPVEVTAAAASTGSPVTEPVEVPVAASTSSPVTEPVEVTAAAASTGSPVTELVEVPVAASTGSPVTEPVEVTAAAASTGSATGSSVTESSVTSLMLASTGSATEGSATGLGKLQGHWQSKAFHVPMPTHWQHLLRGIAQNPQQNAMRIPLFDLAERRLLLIEKNQSPPLIPHPQGERNKLAGSPAHVELFPQKPSRSQRPGRFTALPIQDYQLALVSAEQQLSYDDLHEQAGQLADDFRQQGAGDAVAVSLDANAPAAMLALQQLGKACVFGPVLQEKGIGEKIDAACILDTGVHFSHRALEQFYATQPWASPARTLAVADAQMYWQLCLSTLHVGGTWIHAPCADAASLAEALRHYQVERAFIPTTLLLELAALNPALPQLKELIHLGAALPVTDDVRVWLSGGDIALYNLYHLPDSLGLCVYRAPPDIAAWSDWLPVGAVLGGNAAYVLDPNQQPVPIGMAGELYLSGPGVGQSSRDRVQLALHRQQLVMMPEQQNPLLTETCQVMQACRSYQQARYREDGVLDVLPPNLENA